MDGRQTRTLFLEKQQQQTEKVHWSKGGKSMHKHSAVPWNADLSVCVCVCVCLCAAYCVPVHETPDCSSNFTSKEDHQKEEELKKENQRKIIGHFEQKMSSYWIKAKKERHSLFPTGTEIPEWHRNIQGSPPASSQPQQLSVCTHLWTQRRQEAQSYTWEFKEHH